MLGEAAFRDVPAAGAAHGVQHPAVVGDQQHRAGEAVQRPAPAARWPAGRGGWSARRAPAGSPRGPAAGPARRGCARRGTATSAGRGTCSAVSPNLASSVRTSACPPVRHRVAERPDQRLRAEEQPAGLVDLADPHPGAQPGGALVDRDPAEQRAAAGWTCPEPLAPVIDHPVRPVDLGVDRAEGERRRGAPPRRAARRPRRPERGAAAMLIRSSHSLRGSSTTSSRSIRRSVWRALAACFSLVSARSLRPILSLSVALRRALRTPTAIQLRCVRARSSSPASVLVVLLVGLPGVPAGHLALGQVGLVAAVVDARPAAGPGRARRPGSRCGPGTPGRG